MMQKINGPISFYAKYNLLFFSSCKTGHFFTAFIRFTLLDLSKCDIDHTKIHSPPKINSNASDIFPKTRRWICITMRQQDT